MISIDQITYNRKGFSLTIPTMQLNAGITILVGKNGAGKSTFLQLLATALKPHRGSITYGRKTVGEALPFIRKQIGFLPTGVELYEEMKTRQFLTYMSELKGISTDKAVETSIQAMKLEDVKKTKIKSLSQGMKQRVGIAQALLDTPSFLLLDEPLNYLDSQERKNVVSLLSRYGKSKLVLVATHDLNEWEEIADHIIWLSDGQVLFDGPLTLWKNNSGRVWEGRVKQHEISSLDFNRITYMKRSKDDVIVKYISESKPFETFTLTTTTIEDAYFIRKYSS
ncbi:ABC transporter ATP-binding protein [Guptibacillus algicola]|uniref:ABC transporter ATP-binding protein n=1 Tax=Guptibacillus algicola TaxID=225844 RepID=UPI001CD24851|nr:ATP-binding cassette domain-containing protein [Alkalihalobacillus algicola]MCA0986713.1 ATP-binding cassette domain-containing protein [Alkalihalobacillus algicola]